MAFSPSAAPGYSSSSTGYSPTSPTYSPMPPGDSLTDDGKRRKLEVKEHRRGGTENIMLGQLTPIGTGSCSLYLIDEVIQKLKALDLSLPSFADGLEYGMTLVRSPITGMPDHEGMMSPSSLLSSNISSSPITDAQFSPYIGGMAFSPSASLSYSQPSPTYSPTSSYNTGGLNQDYSSTSAQYSSSGSYSPTSPGNSPQSSQFSPQMTNKHDE